jgi:Flp pilus assembly pilin Flp
MGFKSLKKLLRDVHEDQHGAISIETILIIGAIALPILIFLLYHAWPKIRDYFNRGVETLQTDPSTAAGS